MKIDVHSRHHPLTAGLRDLIHERLSRSLRTGAERVQLISVQLSDLNGPRGGVDSLCSVVVHLDGGAGTVTVRDVAETPFRAAASAVTRTGRAVRRAILRRRDVRRRPRSA